MRRLSFRLAVALLLATVLLSAVLLATGSAQSSLADMPGDTALAGARNSQVLSSPVTITSTSAGNLKVETGIGFAAAPVLVMWNGSVESATLVARICNNDKERGQSIYINGVFVARTPEGPGLWNRTCECFDSAGYWATFAIDPNVVVYGTNWISGTNANNPADTWKLEDARIVLTGDITGPTRSSFDVSAYVEGGVIQGAAQLPVGYDPNHATPLLIALPDTTPSSPPFNKCFDYETKDDGLDRFAVRANEAGWLVASLDPRIVYSKAATPLAAKSPSLDVQHDVMKLVRYMEEHFNVDRSRIYVAGYSAGAGMALTIAAKYPDVFAGVVEYAGPTHYGEWHDENLNRYDWHGEFDGGEFEILRRSSRLLARNLRLVPVRIVHGTADTEVRVHHAVQMYDAMASFYSPTANGTEIFTPSVGHKYPVTGYSETDLAFLARGTLVEDTQELNIISDEGKDYYWLRIAKEGVADDAWQNWAEVETHFDLATGRIWVDARDDEVPAKTLLVTLDLSRMHLNTAQAYDIEQYDPQTGDFLWHPAVWPAGGKLTLTVARNAFGSVNNKCIIYPATGSTLRRARLQQGLDDYDGADDTYIVAPGFAGENSGTAHGSLWQMLVSYDLRAKALLRFDLGELPPQAQVKSAHLSFNMLQAHSTAIDMSAFEVLRPWHDEASTWVLAEAGQPWISAGADGIGSDRAGAPEDTARNVRAAGTYTLSVRSLVLRWLSVPSTNHGLILVGTGARNLDKLFIGSADNGDSSKRPILDIEYLEPPQPTPTPTATATATPTATPTPSFVIAKEDLADPVLAGDTISYVITVQNTGATVILGMVLTDTLPEGTHYVGSQPEGILAGNQVVWHLDALPPMRSESLQLDIGTTAMLSGALVNDVSASAGGITATATQGTTVLLAPEPTATSTPTATSSPAPTATSTPRLYLLYLPLLIKHQP